MSVVARSDNVRLALSVKHPFNQNTDLDVILAQNLVLSFTGLVNRVQIPAETFVNSALALHLASVLNRNATILGIDGVSEWKIDGKTAQLTICPSRSYIPTARTIPHFMLEELEAKISWSLPANNLNCTRQSPFADQLALPYQTLLDDAFRRFINHHLIKTFRRYPLIFGKWSQQLDLEKLCFPSVARSMLHIVKRTQSDSFREECMALLKSIKRTSKKRIESVINSLQVEEEFSSDLTMKEALCVALEHVYKDGLSLSFLKGLRQENSDLDLDYMLENSTQELEQLPLNAYPLHAFQEPIPFQISSQISDKSVIEHDFIFASPAHFMSSSANIAVPQHNTSTNDDTEFSRHKDLRLSLDSFVTNLEDQSFVWNDLHNSSDSFDPNLDADDLIAHDISQDPSDFSIILSDDEQIDFWQDASQVTTMADSDILFSPSFRADSSLALGLPRAVLEMDVDFVLDENRTTEQSPPSLDILDVDELDCAREQGELLCFDDE
ncbi:hypothetical protein DL96DRAFT_1557773 [Flagelloscypha sp. PMI_526]|nr:hypothetical protein DL96DRAFT_1557773 [Flagelloscypha sp. PMI_526]